MARTDTLTNFLTDVAVAIKTKKGDNTAIPAANFDTEIANLPSGDDETLKGLIERNLTSITIPDSVTSIGRWAFSFCSSLTSVTIPNSVTSIRDNAFNSCAKLTSITIPNSVTSIGNSAFSSCSGLTSITIPDSVTSIEGSAFYYCTGLTSVTIGNSVTSIGGSAFYECTSLTSITIPDSVTRIGGNTFAYCSNLLEIDFSTHNAVPTLVAANAFKSTSANLVIKVPSALVDEWKTATNWSTYASKIVGV